MERRRGPKDGRQGLRIHGRDARRVEVADPPLQLGRSAERLLDGDLLVQREADQQRERFGDKQAVGIVVAGERERGGHGHARMVVPDC